MVVQRLQWPPVTAIIILIFNSLMILSSAAPIYEQFQEVDLPTDGLTAIDLSRLSDGELLQLERALQNKIEEFENEQEGFVEDSIPIPTMEVGEDDEQQLRKMVRDRRAGGHPVVPVLGDDGAVELFPLTDASQPVVIIEEPISQQIPEDREFVLIPETEEEAMLPMELEAAAQIQAALDGPQYLSARDIDELELRQRIAELGEHLTERANRGL